MPQARDGKLCRIRLEQGHITAAQLQLLADLASAYGKGIIELTSRANIQLRGIKSESAARLISALEEGGLAPITPAGDGVRNVMVNPTAGFDPQGNDQILPLARQLSTILQTTPRYQTLSPKFSIFLDGGEACALIHHISDIWLSLCDGGKNFAFGLASRPPLEADTPLALERFTKSVTRFSDKKRGKNKEFERSTQPNEGKTALGKVPVNKAQDLILSLIDLLLEIRQHHPHIGRMKHLLSTSNIAVLLQQSLPFIEEANNFRRAPQKPHAHLGIHSTDKKSRFYLGFKPPLGRLNPTQAKFIADKMAGEALRLTPWQSFILPDLAPETTQKQVRIFSDAGFITRPTQALAHIVCCAGNPGCGAAKSDVLGDAMRLAQKLEGKDFAPIHLTGCAKSCAASEAKATTLVAREDGIYDLFTADKNAPSPFGRLVATALTINQAAIGLTQQGTELLPESHC